MPWTLTEMGNQGISCCTVLLFRFVGLDDLESALAGVEPKADLAEIRQLLIDITEGSGLQAKQETFKAWVIQVMSTRKVL